jgi:hypothetical protein
MNTVKAAALAFALGCLAVPAGVMPAAAENLSHFAGNWSGSGLITLQNGSKERIKCRGRYTVNGTGNALKLGLRCASDSYNFELQSDIALDGGTVSGSWNETTRQVFGSLSGRMHGTRIDATANSVGFNAALSLTTRGNSQHVSIRSPGNEMTEVAITLARR